MNFSGEVELAEADFGGRSESSRDALGRQDGNPLIKQTAAHLPASAVTVGCGAK